MALLAPATFWFVAPDALSEVTARVAIWSGDQDDVTGPEHAHRICQEVSSTSMVQHSIVPNAGHFSFLSPFPVAMIKPGFQPAQDPHGFDRRAFQPILHEQLVGFFQGALGPPQSSSGAPSGK